MSSEIAISPIEKRVLEKLASRNGGSLTWLSGELGVYRHYLRGILETMAERGLIQLIKGKKGIMAVLITDLGRKLLEEAKAKIS